MYQLNLSIQTLAPVIIASKYGEINTINSQKYIPGTTILGLLAWQFLKADKHSNEPNADFYHIFLDGGITFTDAWFTRKNEYDEDTTFYPTPLSLRAMKQNEQELYDFLFVKDDFDEQTQSVNKFISKEERKLTQPDLELHHHHQRDRIKGSPVDGQIFTYEAISPHQVFKAKIKGEKEWLQKLIQKCGQQWTGWIGRSRNSQYGQVKIDLDDPVEIEPFPGIQTEVVLTMLSHTLIYNKNGFPETSAKALEDYLFGAAVKKAVIKNTFIENFVGIWGFKKPSEMAFMAGSSFLLDLRNADADKLAALQTKGLGERTGEGLGQIKIENPPEWAKNEDELNKPIEFSEFSRNAEVEEPDFDMPSRAKSIIKSIVDNEIYDRIRCHAAEDLKSFKNLPKGYLISRIQRFLSYRKNDMDNFTTDINAMKDIARQHLNQCRNNKTTLKMLLSDKNLMRIDKIMSREDMQTIQDICDEIDYQPAQDSASLRYIYYDAFLNLMNKKIKAEGTKK